MKPRHSLAGSARRAGSSTLALLVLATALVMPTIAVGALSDETFADDFQSYSFSGSTGSLPWTGPWEESGESNGVGSGSIQVRDEPHCETDPCLNLGRASGPDATVEREADLSRFVSATLTFDYKIHAHDPLPGNGVAALKVSDDGGSNWYTLDTWSLATTTGHLVGSYDISGFMADDTRILFAIAGSDDDSHMNVDNVVIEATAATCYFVGDSSAVHQITSLNLSELDALAAEVTIGDTGTDLRAIALDPVSGELHGATADQLHIVDLTDGAVSTIGPFGSSGPVVFNQIEALAFDPTSGTLYASHRRSDERDLIFQVDPATGALVPDAFGPGTDYVEFSSDVAAQESLIGLAIDASGQMWGMGWNETSQEKLHYIDKTTGSANADFNSRHVAGLSYDPEGTMWGLDPAGEIFETGESANSRDIDNLVNYTGIACQIPPPPVNHPPAFDQDLLDRTDAEGTLVSISSSATDPDAGNSLTYAAAGLPQGVSIDPVSGTITGALGPNSNGTHSVSITVTDDGVPNLGDTDGFTWTVTTGEVTYLVANTGGGNGGDDLLTVVNREDANPITNETNIGTGTGTTNIEAIALQPGTGVLFAVANDQLGTIDVTTGVFTPRPAITGAGSGPVGLIAFNNIESLSFNPFTGELYGTHRRDPSQEDLLFRLDPDIGNHLAGVFGGDDYVLIEKQDPYYHAADMAFDPTDGQAYIVHWDLNGHWTIATLDPTAGATATMWPAPADIASLAFDETGRLFTSTETGSQENLYELNKANGSLLSSIVIDNGGAYEAMAIAFPVEANRPPVFDQDLQNRTDPEGTSVSLSASATDPDAGHSVGYSATGLPPGLSIDPGNGLISGTIAYTGDGTYSVEITARDDGIPNLSSVDTFDWTVTELNQPPVFDQDLPDRIDAEGSVISLPSPATDPDNADILTYGAVGLPPGLSIDTGTGLISGTIDYTAAAASPHAVIITSTDDGAPNESAVPDTFSWTVSNTNRPPVFDGPGAQTTPELAPFTVTLTATDPDGQVPSFSDTGTLPAWAMLTDNGDGSATISGTPGVGDSGTTTITVTASDGGSPDLSDSATFDITVTNTNMPPTITNPGNQTGSENSPFSLTISASDLDGTTVSFSDADTLPDWATLTDNGDDTATISGTPDYDDAMTTTVTITASDGLLNDDAVFDITISNTNRAPLVASIGDQSVAENNPFSLAVSAIDPDGTTPALSGSGLPGWASFADNGDGTGTITGTPGYNDAAVITVTVTAFDGTLFDNTDFDLTVTNTNRAPVVAPVADQLVAEGIALTPVVVSSSDPDGTTPALAATGLPGWASFTDNGDGTGTITGTPGYNDAAATTVTINAEDGGVPNLADSTSFTLTVTETNRAPVANPVVDQSVAEASAIAPIDVSAFDPDGTIPALSATDLPGWASFTDNGDGTGTITGTPGYNDAAVTTVTINASDGDLADTTTFTITVTDTNRSPLISTISDQTLVEGDPLTLSLSASDPDGAAPSLSAVGLPSWATLVDNGDGTGSISGTPAFGDAGISTVTVTASDGSLTDETTFKLTVTAGNRSPVFDTTLSDRTDAEGVSVALDAAATDPDGDPITYAATGLPPGIVIAPTTGAITGTLSYDAAGSHPVTVTVTDNETPILDASQSFVWTVTNTNRAPILVPIPPILGPEQTDLTFTAVANDPDGGTITYSLAGAPAGATIAPDSGVFSWIPSEAQGEGSYAFTVIATDDGSPALTDTKTVTITVAEVNLPPTVDPIGDQQNDQGDLVELVVVATDPDVPLNTFTFAASGLPAGLTIHPTTGTIFGSISAGASGAHDVTVTVTDNGIPPRSGTTSFKWLVGDTNHPPEMDRLSDRTVAEHSPVTIRPVTTDPDGDSLRYEVAGAPPGSTFDPDTGTLRWIPSEEQGPGTYRLSIIAADDGTPELVAIGVVTITVTEVNSPPTVESLPDRADDAGSDVLVQVVAADTDLPTNSLAFGVTDLPPGLVIDPATGLISGQITATTDEVTHYAVTATVTDDSDSPLSATTAFTWTVVGIEALPENFPPAVDPVAGQYSDAGATVELAVQASDTGPVSFTASGLPDGLVIDPATGLIGGIVAAEAVGTHAVVVTVADSGEVPLRTSVSFTWVVIDRTAADQKDDLVVAIADVGPSQNDTTAESVADESRPIRRGLVVMSSAAAATTESMRLPLVLLLALLAGFATIGRIGLYPLLWRGERHTGTIGLYDPELDFGLIYPDDGGEQVFVHANAFPRRQRASLAAGMRIRYRVLAGDNRASAWGATMEVDDG